MATWLGDLILFNNNLEEGLYSRAQGWGLARLALLHQEFFHYCSAILLQSIDLLRYF
jgi:hypothetical protein